MPFLYCSECGESQGRSQQWAPQWGRCAECGAHCWLKPAERIE